MLVTISYQNSDNKTRVKEYKGISPESIEYTASHLYFKHPGAYQAYKIDRSTINAVIIEEYEGSSMNFNL